MKVSLFEHDVENTREFLETTVQKLQEVIGRSDGDVQDLEKITGNLNAVDFSLKCLLTKYDHRIKG